MKTVIANHTKSIVAGSAVLAVAGLIGAVAVPRGPILIMRPNWRNSLS